MFHFSANARRGKNTTDISAWNPNIQNILFCIELNLKYMVLEVYTSRKFHYRMQQSCELDQYRTPGDVSLLYPAPYIVNLDVTEGPLFLTHLFYKTCFQIKHPILWNTAACSGDIECIYVVCFFDRNCPCF